MKANVYLNDSRDERLSATFEGPSAVELIDASTTEAWDFIRRQKVQKTRIFTEIRITLDEKEIFYYFEGFDPKKNEVREEIKFSFKSLTKYKAPKPLAS